MNDCVYIFSPKMTNDVLWKLCLYFYKKGKSDELLAKGEETQPTFVVYMTSHQFTNQKTRVSIYLDYHIYQIPSYNSQHQYEKRLQKSGATSGPHSAWISTRFLSESRVVFAVWINRDWSESINRCSSKKDGLHERNRLLLQLLCMWILRISLRRSTKISDKVFV